MAVWTSTTVLRMGLYINSSVSDRTVNEPLFRWSTMKAISAILFAEGEEEEEKINQLVVQKLL